jgi:hypothetical protein
VQRKPEPQLQSKLSGTPSLSIQHPSQPLPR